MGNMATMDVVATLPWFKELVAVILVVCYPSIVAILPFVQRLIVQFFNFFRRPLFVFFGFATAICPGITIFSIFPNPAPAFGIFWVRVWVNSGSGYGDWFFSDGPVVRHELWSKFSFFICPVPGCDVHATVPGHCQWFHLFLNPLDFFLIKIGANSFTTALASP